MAEPEHFDVAVVGAGIGGIYALHRFREQGLNVVCLESAAGVGGVWYHNRYPGARVDVQSTEYCYHFSSALYREWQWSERFAAQPELMAYLNHVVDRFDLRRSLRLSTRVTAAIWDARTRRYTVETANGQTLTARFLVMATGNLSAPRKPDFEGIDDFKGEWFQTANWPDRPVALDGKRVAVIGTGSSGVQAVPVVAAVAAHLTVFQRSPNFSVPARNGPPRDALHRKIADDLPARRRELFATRAGMTTSMDPPQEFAAYDDAEREARIEAQWQEGGQGMNRVFADQAVSMEANDAVSEFLRRKIRKIVTDPDTAAKLAPTDHPVGTRRLCVDTDYFETFNRPNVTLVDVGAEPIERFTATGIKTSAGEYPIDVAILALGFNAFSGAMNQIDIRNARGEHPTDGWKYGPRTLLGLMTDGFPNFFFLTGPGSPSVLSNLFVLNEVHADWVGDLIAHMDRNGLDTVEPTSQAVDAWNAHNADNAKSVLRLKVKNYMVHVNEDGSRVFMPYIGGLDRYCQLANEIAQNGYEGFEFTQRASVTEAAE